MGLFNLIKSALGSDQKGQQANTTPPGEKVNYEKIIDAAYNELIARGNKTWWSMKSNEMDTYKTHLLPLTDKQKTGFICWATTQISGFYKNRTSFSSEDKSYRILHITDAFHSSLLRTKLSFTENDLEQVLHCFKTHPKYSNNSLLNWPLGLLVNLIEKQVAKGPLSPEFTKILAQLKSDLEGEVNFYEQKTKQKILQKIELMLHKAGGNSNSAKPTFFPAPDGFGNYANSTIRAMEEKKQQAFFKIMILAQKATGGKPSAKFLNEIQEAYKEFGQDKYKQLVNDWISFITAMKEKTETYTTEYYNTAYSYNTTEFIDQVNIDMIKGIVWSMVFFFDKTTLFNIAQLADRTYRKIPGKGPACMAVGNACLYVLANVRGMDGIGHLSRLRLRIKQANTQSTIEKYLEEAAKEQGVSLHEIEDMAVDDYDLVEGKREYELEGFKAVLQINGVGKTLLQWYKPDGTEQKAIPLIVKERQAAKLKKIKDTGKQVELTTTAQRDRLDRMFISNRAISGTAFYSLYWQHGLMQFLTKKIIWTVEQSGNKQSVFYLNNTWVNQNGDTIEVSFDDNTLFSLWHPVFSTVDEIKNWRAFMMHHHVIQPLKQAYREVYLLTDAEINTRTYSNRMAAHILKQHQFNSLAKTRGWKYALKGGFDGGYYKEFASLDLKEYKLRAEFWVNEVDNPDAINETGIWLYVATDQLRFTDSIDNSVRELIEIPDIVFSEIMRDADLFVGVASVGNDPNWRDNGGLQAYRTYWESYSFGDLNELAKTRKTMLEILLPKLKVAAVAEIKDKFLVVKGKLRTYKIHIGSTNILMEPNDQYLCIVPDRSRKDGTENLFLPFEGDSGLSVILSKAILLAEDDKITDKTITSQINRK